MDNTGGEFQFITCKCGKILRLKISERSYDKKIIVTCPSCRKSCSVTIPHPESNKSVVDADFQEVIPYAELLVKKLSQAMNDAGTIEDIAKLRSFLLDRGFGINLVLSVSLVREEYESDADFLKSINVKYD